MRKNDDELGKVGQASREAAEAAAREAQELDRAEEGPYEVEQARGHTHESDPFEPHEREAMADAVFRSDLEEDGSVDDEEDGDIEEAEPDGA